MMKYMKGTTSPKKKEITQMNNWTVTQDKVLGNVRINRARGRKTGFVGTVLNGSLGTGDKYFKTLREAKAYYEA